MSSPGWNQFLLSLSKCSKPAILPIDMLNDWGPNSKAFRLLCYKTVGRLSCTLETAPSLTASRDIRKIRLKSTEQTFLLALWSSRSIPIFSGAFKTQDLPRLNNKNAEDRCPSLSPLGTPQNVFELEIMKVYLTKNVVSSRLCRTNYRSVKFSLPGARSQCPKTQKGNGICMLFFLLQRACFKSAWFWETDNNFFQLSIMRLIPWSFRVASFGSFPSSRSFKNERLSKSERGKPKPGFSEVWGMFLT